MTDLNLQELKQIATNAQPFVYHGGVDPARVSIPAEQALALIARIETAEHRIARYKALAEARQTTIQRVRDVHVAQDGCTNIGHSNPESVCPDCYTYCTACGDHYPCPTIQAIGDPK